MTEKIRKIFEDRPIFDSIKPSHKPFKPDKDDWQQRELKSEGDEVRKLLMDPKVYASVVGAARGLIEHRCYEIFSLNVDSLLSYYHEHAVCRRTRGPGP